MLHAEHHTAHQRRHRGVEAPDLEAFDAAGLCRAAGIVEQAIDPSEFFHRLADQRAHLILDRDVCLAKDAGGAELAGKRLALRRAATRDDDFGAFGDEYFRGAQTDTAGRAGDHRDLAAEPSHVVLLVLSDVGATYIPGRTEQRKRRLRRRAAHPLSAWAGPEFADRPM